MAWRDAFSGEAATQSFWIKLMNVVLIITWATLGICCGRFVPLPAPGCAHFMRRLTVATLTAHAPLLEEKSPGEEAGARNIGKKSE
jgi:hypothetical protein